MTKCDCGEPALEGEKVCGTCFCDPIVTVAKATNDPPVTSIPIADQLRRMEHVPDNHCPEDQKEVFASGAARQAVRLPSYDLIPPEVMRRVGLRFTDGREKYGAYNYCAGIPTSNLFNHV
jgi:hypothetical protein